MTRLPFWFIIVILLSAIHTLYIVYKKGVLDLGGGEQLKKNENKMMYYTGIVLIFLLVLLLPICFFFEGCPLFG